MKQLTAKRPVRSVIRSDGAAKVYGWTEDGELVTVVMVPGGRTGYDITEIKIGGKFQQTVPRTMF